MDGYRSLVIESFAILDEQASELGRPAKI